jgi:hypothetical protein
MEEHLNEDTIFTGDDLDQILGDIAAEPETPDEEEQETQEEDVVEEQEDGQSDSPESVGNEEPPAQQPGSPTPQNLFKSIAAALREEGVFPDADDNEINSVQDARTFRDLINRQIQAGLTDQQRRISSALGLGVPPSDIKQYEGALAYLDNINEEMLTARSADGENLRKTIIAQDMINRGYSEDKIRREIKKSLDAGTDIDDAKEAFAANKQYFQSRYKAILDNAQEQRQRAEAAYAERARKFEKSLLEDKTVFGTVEVDDNTRRRVLEVLTKPTKRGDNGRYYTELQYEQSSDPDKFSRNVGLLYVLTNGFKDVDKLIGQEVNRRSAKGLSALERVINDTQRNPDGSLNLLSGVNTDKNSFFDDFDLDV